MAALLVPEAVWAILAGQGVIGVLSHCPGMCGPLMAAFRFQGPWAGTVGLLAYQAGRASVYAVLGAGAGVLGGAVAQSLGQVLPWATLAMALGLGAMAIIQLVGFVPRWQALSPPWMQSLVRMTAGRGVGPSFLLGLGMAALPCGLVLWALGLAAATEQPLVGALTMVGLVVLTTPVLLAAHWAGRTTTAPFLRWRARFHWLPPALLLASALWLAGIGFAKLTSYGMCCVPAGA